MGFELTTLVVIGTDCMGELNIIKSENLIEKIWFKLYMYMLKQGLFLTNSTSV